MLVAWMVIAPVGIYFARWVLLFFWSLHHGFRWNVLHTAQCQKGLVSHATRMAIDENELFKVVHMKTFVPGGVGRNAIR